MPKVFFEKKFSHPQVPQVFEIPENSWKFLKIPENSWKFLIFSDFSWFFLIFPEYSWKFLKIPDFFWIFLKIPYFSWIFFLFPKVLGVQDWGVSSWYPNALQTWGDKFPYPTAFFSNFFLPQRISAYPPAHRYSWPRMFVTNTVLLRFSTLYMFTFSSLPWWMDLGPTAQLHR